MQIFKGYCALSPYQNAKVLKDIQSLAKGVFALRTQFLHLVKCQKKLTKQETDMLTTLFAYGVEWQGDTTRGKKLDTIHTFIVLPRIGTISPWSSKTTDIVKTMGMDTIQRIERATVFSLEGHLSQKDYQAIFPKIHDRMTEEVFTEKEDINRVFCCTSPPPFHNIPLREQGIEPLLRANKDLGLALSVQEISYLKKSYDTLHRNPTDVELYMFAQVNSEHCRHKIFTTNWEIDGSKQQHSLFSMIRNTTSTTANRVLSAYKDNAAVIEGTLENRFYADTRTHTYAGNREYVDFLIKVETHNHPTAIAPYSGSATGIGGEIRDEGATGIGAKPKAGLTGFSVSNLNIAGFVHPWERYYGSALNKETYGKPDHIASALDIMLHAPIGGARYGNEFGRPNLVGYFRTFEQCVSSTNGVEVYGYHKPVMIAGGLGNIVRSHVEKKAIEVGSHLICLGGPAMRIGLGGGAASSTITAQNSAELDFASVQRGNAEMQRRCQEVIDRCWQLGQDNPITFIHDVGAGGISNAFPELIKDGGVGGIFELRKVDLADSGMSPLEIWCNESQERYVLSIPKNRLEQFDAIAKRERCPYAVVGEATAHKHLTVNDRHFNNTPIDIPMDILFGEIPKTQSKIQRTSVKQEALKMDTIELDEAVERILRLPTVASKSFLITIGDRTITGMVARDQMVGPWQIPVADCAVTTTTLYSNTGEVMAMGERPALSILNSATSARMAVGETLTNIAAGYIEKISDICLSANWMAAVEHGNEAEKLYDGVYAVGMEFCPALGIAIPVGKDSLSMRTQWREKGQEKSVTAPMSLIVSGFARTPDVRKTLTPQLQTDVDSVLLLLDLGAGKNRLGGSCLAQIYNQIGNTAPDIEAKTLKNFFETTQNLNRDGKIIAYHDRSDGGVFVTLLEMAFAGKTGLDITVATGNILDILFNEELGAVIQVKSALASEVIKTYSDAGICVWQIGTINNKDTISFMQGDTIVYQKPRPYLQRCWAQTSYVLQSLRDNKNTALQEFDRILDTKDPGLHAKVTFNLTDDIAAPFIHKGIKPKIAILREQGVNGHVEMAHVFTEAGFTAVDVHMSDLQDGRIWLKDFNAMVACGGFSYGDTLGAGRGWAYNILYNPLLKEQFANFFQRKNTLILGVCNGCQMFSHLKSIIPGAENWPIFVKNTSEQFEARLSMVRVEKSDSLWFDGMQGTRAPIPVAHGEGNLFFPTKSQQQVLLRSRQIALRFTDNYGAPTQTYPSNPNGAVEGITALTALDGRMQIMMPHPERVYRTVTNSWAPKTWEKYGVWMRMFRNARKYFG